MCVIPPINTRLRRRRTCNHCRTKHCGRATPGSPENLKTVLHKQHPDEQAKTARYRTKNGNNAPFSKCEQRKKDNNSPKASVDRHVTMYPLSRHHHRLHQEEGGPEKHHTRQHHHASKTSSGPCRFPMYPVRALTGLVANDVLVRAEQRPVSRRKPHPHAAVFVDEEALQLSRWRG